jgi:hypothetical protein
MAGAYGAVMQIVFKGTGELVGAAAFDSPALWVSAVAIVPLATAQMAYLNVGMQVCNAVKFFPSYNASLIVLMTLTGMIYYEEYKQLKGAKDWLCFCAGIVLVVCGVLLLTLRNSSEQPDKGQVVPSDPRDSIEAGPPGSNPSSRPSSAAGVYPNGQPIVRKSSFTIPQDDSGRMMAVNALPFVDPRSVSTGSNPPSPGHSGPPSPSGGEKSLFDVSKGPKASPMPTIVAGETPMASMTVEEAADFKQAMRTREEEEQRLGAELQEKLRVAALEREERDAAEARAEAEAKHEPPEP